MSEEWIEADFVGASVGGSMRVVDRIDLRNQSSAIGSPVDGVTGANIYRSHGFLDSLGTFGISRRLLPIAPRAQLLDRGLPQVVELTHRNEQPSREAGNVETTEHEAC